MTTILSIARGHNGSTTLMKDGEIIFYLEEERLSRFKYDGTPLMGSPISRKLPAPSAITIAAS